jgi:hypothetical protein
LQIAFGSSIPASPSSRLFSSANLFTLLGAALILAGNLLNLKPNSPVPAPAGI